MCIGDVILHFYLMLIKLLNKDMLMFSISMTMGSIYHTLNYVILIHECGFSVELILELTK